MKLLTISIAGYNVERYITQTLESLCCSRLYLFLFDVGEGTGSKYLKVFNYFFNFCLYLVSGCAIIP